MFLPYPKIKDSGVEWLGQIPECWNVDRLKWSTTGCFNGIWGDEPNGGDDDIVCVRVADFIRTKFLVVDNPPTLRAVDKGQREHRVLRKGDLLIEKSGGGDQQLVGCVVYFDREYQAVCSNFVARMPIAADMHPRFWSYVHAALYAGRLNYPSIKQTTGIQNLDAAAYLNEKVVFPPVEEQEAISSFLDRKAAIIDDLITKRERQIELLQEQRAALINWAVTKGLNPNVPMMDSGVEWIGEVPEHWCIRRIKHLVSCPGSGIQMGPFGGMLKNLSEIETGVKLYGQENTISGDFTTGSRWIPPEKHAELACYLVKPGDIVLTRKGSVGNARVFPMHAPNGVIDSDTIRLRVDSDKIQIEYLVRLLHESWYISAQIEATKRGAILAGLNTSTIAELRVVVPPIDEQTTLAAFLGRETAKIDTFITKVQQSIGKLCEYRQSLISAAVTGKIDVRGHAASATSLEVPV